MKKINILGLCFGLFSLLLTSCDFEDVGVLEIEPLADLVIDTTGIPLTHSVGLGDNFDIRPKVSRDGVSEDNLSYEWWITRMPGADFTLKTVISEEKDLTVPLEGLTPSSDYYSLWLRVTDNTTKLMRGVVFRVIVEPPLNQGLVVADSEDGISSDLSLIQDTIFTFQYVDKITGEPLPTSYRRNEFSKVHGRKFNGIIHSLFSQRLYQDQIYNNFLHGASRNNAFRLNTLDYSLVAEGKELFYDPDIVLDIDAYFLNGPNQAWIINAGRVSNRLTETRTFAGYRKFSIEVPGDYTLNKHIAVHPTTSSNAIAYDEGEGRFLRYGTSLDPRVVPNETSSESTPFAPRNLPGYTVLGGGLGNLSEVRFVLKKDNYYGVFTLTNNATAAPRRQIDISDAPDISEAVSFVFPIDQAVIYYATPQKVYSIRIPQGGAVTYTDLYTSPDPITDLQMMRRSGTRTVTYSERVLLAVTYNGSEGKITTLPIPSSGLDLGLIDLSRSATFGGFKKISAVAIQE